MLHIVFRTPEQVLICFVWESLYTTNSLDPPVRVWERIQSVRLLVICFVVRTPKRACATVFIGVGTVTVFWACQWINDQIRKDFVYIMHQTTKDFWRQICNNNQNNCPISMKMSAWELPAQDTSLLHTSFCFILASKRGIIVLHPPHLSTL